MNQQPQRQPAPAPATIPTASTVAEGRKLAENLMEVMSALLAVIERETELVRAGKIREAMALEPKKTDLSRRYVHALAYLKASQKFLDMAYEGLNGLGVAKMAIALRTPDYGDLLPQMLKNLDDGNLTNPHYLGWARHSYGDWLNPIP